MRHHRRRPAADGSDDSSSWPRPRTARSARGSARVATISTSLDVRARARRGRARGSERVARAAFPASRHCLQSPELARRDRRDTDDIAFAIAARRREARRRCESPDRLERINAALSASRTRAGRSRRIGCAPPRPSATCSTAPADARAVEAFTSVQIALERARPARGPGPRLGRPPPARARPQPRSRLDRRHGAARPARRRPAVPHRRRPHARRHARLRLQGGGRDRRARRQHRRAARGDHVRRAAAPRRRRRHGRGHRPRPHAVGERRHHLAGERPPARLRGDGGSRRPVRRGRAQRRRRQLRRPEVGRGSAHRRRDHDRREGHPDARVAPACARASTLERVVPRDRRRLRRLGRHRRQLGGRARSSAARAARKRSGAVRRARRGRATSSRASRTGSSRRPRATCAWTARRRPTPTTRPPAAASSSSLDGSRAGTLEGIERLGYDGTVLPVTDDDVVVAQITTRDIDRGNYRALPAEGDQRVAGVVPQDVARQARRTRRPARARARRRGACRPTSATTWRPGASRGSIAIGQGTAHVAGQSFVAALESMAPDTASTSTRRWPPSCQGSACEPT